MESTGINKLASDSKNNNSYKSKKKDLTAKSTKKAVHTVLDNTIEADSPMPAQKRIHTIHYILTKEELKKLGNPLISTYFTTRENQQIAEQPEQPVPSLPHSKEPFL